MQVNIALRTIILTAISLLKSIYVINCKCSIEKETVNCFGMTWKQDLLPIENDSLQKLNISKCSKSNQYSNTFDISFIKNLSKLKLLSITECELKRPPTVHDQINSVEIINLSNNLIDERSQFDAFGMNFFKRLPNLRILDLSKNKLKELPKIWFDCKNKVETLNLNDNLISGLDPSLSSCFKHLKHLYLRNNLFVVLKKPTDSKSLSHSSFSRLSQGFQIDKKVKRIQPQLPVNSRHKGGKTGSNSKNYMNIIPQFSSLETLDLAFNKIYSIDQIPLSDLQNLSKLNLRGNRLSSYMENNFPENKCDFGTAPFYIKGKIGLTHLDLSENTGLTRINNCWTFGLPNLQTLEISNCSISSIVDSAFEKMKTLTKLDMSHNQLSEVPKELIMVSNTLIDLNLAFNNISQLRSASLIRLENLQILNMSHNQFQSFLILSSGDSYSNIHDSIVNFPSTNGNPESDEPVGLLSRMRYLQELDFSYNNLIKVSAITDFGPSIKINGGLWRINLKGNGQLSQLTDFNYKEITQTLSVFSLSNQSNLACNCHLYGFIKWIVHREIEVSVKCSSPDHLVGEVITSSRVVKSISQTKNCDEKSEYKTFKPTFRLKIWSNSNQTSDTILDGGPMNNNIKMSVSGNKKQTDQQKWAMIGSNLILRCEFYSSFQRFFKPIIEWQRIKLLPAESIQYNSDGNHQNNYPFLKTENSEALGLSKYNEKIEVLNSHFDTRIKNFQSGPFDDVVDLDKFGGQSFNSTIRKNLSNKFTDKPFKYVSYLSMQSMYLSDSGRYRCLVNDLPVNQFYGQTQIISKEEDIKIYYPPRFTATPSNPMSIIEGETAEITCRADGYPTPMTSLGRIGSKDFPAARGRRMVIYKDDSSFFINLVRQVDAGNYSCISRNAAGTISFNFTLKVQIPASFNETAPSTISIQSGQPLVIKFKVKGIPSPTIKWFKDGVQIIGNDHISFSKDNLVLAIQSCTVEDAAQYKISILNALGGSEASVTVRIIDNNDNSHKSSLPSLSNTKSEPQKEINWMSDYWLSAIIIIVVLSILLTSILWITVFLCFGKLIGSKKRRLLLISNSQSKSSFDKCLASTTNISNPRTMPSNVCHIPLSLTTSTIVRHDQSHEECHKIGDSDLAFESFKTSSEFYSPQIPRSCFPEIQSTYSINNHLFHSQPYLTTSKLDLSSSLNQSSSRNHHKVILKNEACDSGIDSSHIYSETLNSSDISSIYKCRHKSKHKTNNLKRKRHQNVNPSEYNESLKSTSEIQKTLYISDNVNNSESNVQNSNINDSNKDYLPKQSKFKKLCNPTKNCSTPLIDSSFPSSVGRI